MRSQHNYLKTAAQNLRSHKAYLAINTIGLAVGIAACLLIFLLIQYETSFDDFHKNKERIYRVVAATKTQTGMNYSKASAFPVAEALRIDYPQLEGIARIYIRDDKQVALPNDDANAPQKKFKERYFLPSLNFSTSSTSRSLRAIQKPHYQNRIPQYLHRRRRRNILVIGIQPSVN